MSLWLSGANATIGRSRGRTTAAAKAQTAALMNQTTRFWTKAWFAGVTPKRRR
jgi:hypothetical protein